MISAESEWYFKIYTQGEQNCKENEETKNKLKRAIKMSHSEFIHGSEGYIHIIQIQGKSVRKY